MPARQNPPIPHPPPLPSHLPDSVLDLAVRLARRPLPDPDRESLAAFQRAAWYIAAGELPAPSSPRRSLDGRGTDARPDASHDLLEG